MKFILNYLKGLSIGAGAILPGISSGVLCVLFGIYDKLINSILNFFIDWKNNSKFLLPIMLGGVTGIVIFSNILEFLFCTYPIQTKFSFIGLILGSLPILFKTANSKKGFRLRYVFFLIVTLILGIIMLCLENSINNSNTTIYCINTYSFIFLVIAGFLMSVGVVVPGVSSSVILMILGVYELYLSAVSNINISILFPMAIGLLIGGYIFMRIIQTLLNNFFSETYYGIIGFVIGSIPILYPGFSLDTTGIISILLFCICFYIAYNFEKK